MKKYAFSLLFVFVAAITVAQSTSPVPKGASMSPVGNSNVLDTAKPKKKGELVQPIKVWKEGKIVEADLIDLTSVYDDLESSAKLYYVMKDSVGSVITDGNLSVSGQDYQTWVTAPNKINWIYRYAIRELKLASKQAK